MPKKTFDQISRATPRQRAAAEAYAAAELEKMRLPDLRRARHLSQVDIAERLDTTQGGISRLEGQADIYVRSLRRYVEAAGGKLVISAIFPNARPIEIEGFGDIEPPHSNGAGRTMRAGPSKGAPTSPNGQGTKKERSSRRTTR